MVGREWAFRNAGGQAGAGRVITLPRMPRVLLRMRSRRSLKADTANRTDGARRQERVASRKAHGAEEPRRSEVRHYTVEATQRMTRGDAERNRATAAPSR
ncbi:hypothetical protein BZM27_48720 [Paraburkholderia steynii]|uniref:Uncharacterized protein n=1 Tax=Paraburkholderia steynii TaxID=1245441 RepID=A0A4R0X0A5_9BURK|nr:hypothetical protein BZM27_48720 [Paraburkholderia steynii]